jgi:hypothetical protein
MTHENHTAARWTPLGSKLDTRAPRTWPRYMTARVAADYADTSSWTIRRHVPPCGRRGRSYIYSIESVEAWMQGDMLRDRNSDPRPVSKPRRLSAASRPRVRDLANVDQPGRPVADEESNVAA